MYWYLRESVKSIVESSLNGVSGTIFLYGQTGSGKTYTMLGPNRNQIYENNGVLIHSFEEIVYKLQNDSSKNFNIKCSYFEIYNENVYDLLKPESQLGEILQISEDSKKEFYIK